ncbi:MAG: twin-arginine translocase TatA/TatE family subunit [Pseudomonadota bacterium]
MMPGPWELMIILIIVLVIFGGKRIPEIMGGLGKGIRSFKKSMETDDPEPATTPQSVPGPAQASAPTPKPVEPK